MNPIGIQYLYWNDIPLRQAVELTARSGAEVFECGTTVLTNLTRQERQDLSRMVRDHGLSLTLNGGMPGADPCSPDQAVREESIRLCQQAIDAAADAGSSIWGGIIYSKWLDIPNRTFTAQDRADMWARGVETMRRVMPAAEDAGVKVCFEIVNRFEAYMITTADEGIRFCQEIESPSAQLLLDVFHMNIEEDSIPTAMERVMSAGRFGHLHISESNRGLPGLAKTDMPWETIIGTLKRINYQGVVTMEPMVLQETPTSYKYRIWRDMVRDGSLDTLLHSAADSVAFIKEIMKA